MAKKTTKRKSTKKSNARKAANRSSRVSSRPVTAAEHFIVTEPAPIAVVEDAPLAAVAPVRSRRTMLDSRAFVWGIAVLALLLLCATAAIAFGIEGDHKSTAPERMSTIEDRSGPLLTVVGTGGDIAGTDAGSMPSGDAAAALQSQSTTTAPQSTGSPSPQAGGAVSGSVTLQAPTTSNITPTTLNSLDFGL